MNYKSYLQSDHWKKTRGEKLNSYPYCRICKSEINLNIHHKYYSKRNQDSILFNEKNKHLITFCRSCHTLWHKYCHRVIDGDGKPNRSKKIMAIRELLSFGVQKSWAFKIVGLNLWEVARHKIKNYAISI